MAGHAALVFREKRSQLKQLCEIMRAHHVAMNSQDKAVGSQLRAALATIQGRRGMLSADSKVAAYRIGRQFFHVAGLNTEIARAYRYVDSLYEDLFENRNNARPKFDPNA